MKSDITWFNGSGYPVSKDDVIRNIKEHISLKGSVFVGSDSVIRHDGCVFVTAVCLHGAVGQIGGRYFFYRIKDKSVNLALLKMRIMKEVQQSIDMGIDILEYEPEADVEIHIDIGSSDRSKTRHLVDAMVGWTKGSGFTCKIKPHAWASASVADKHTK